MAIHRACSLVLEIFAAETLAGDRFSDWVKTLLLIDLEAVFAPLLRLIMFRFVCPNPSKSFEVK